MHVRRGLATEKNLDFEGLRWWWRWEMVEFEVVLVLMKIDRVEADAHTLTVEGQIVTCHEGNDREAADKDVG